MVRRIRGLGMEVCTTLGMLTPEQAAELRTAGLTAYNHNLDTSPEYYSTITSSRKYEVSQLGCMTELSQRAGKSGARSASGTSVLVGRTTSLPCAHSLTPFS